MDDRKQFTPPPPPGSADAASPAIATPCPAQGADDAILHEEIEVWLNEGGAGDEPAP